MNRQERIEEIKAVANREINDSHFEYKEQHKQVLESVKRTLKERYEIK